MPKGVPAPGPWDLPGDNVNLENEGLAEGEHIFIRMGTIVRARRLDLRLLMDAHDLHNRGFVDKQTFQRSLAYAFGNQWIDLVPSPPSRHRPTLRGIMRGAFACAACPRQNAVRELPPRPCAPTRRR